MTDDDQVRRLLADARHDEPMPDDVAARLDEVLADLRDDRPAATVDHAARQRRRHVRSWVLAAAAVVVVGIGANQVDWSGMSSSGDDSGSASSAMESEANDEDAAGGDFQGEAPSPEMQADGGRADWKAAREHLSSDGFGAQVEEFRQSRRYDLRRLHITDLTSSEAAPGATAYSALCDIGDVGPGHRFAVRYDGERAWLVFRPARGDTQVVDLYLCGLEKPTRSITLPAP